MKEKQKMAEVYIRYISNKLNLKAIKAFPLKCKSRRMCKLYNGEFWKMPQNRQGGCGSNLLEFLQIIPKGDGILGTACSSFFWRWASFELFIEFGTLLLLFLWFCYFWP